MSTLPVYNFRRLSYAHPAKAPRCPVCRTRRPYSTRSGHDDPADLEAEHVATGLCSWTCFAVFYRLLDEDDGPACHCGRPVPVPCAICVSCRIRTYPAQHETGLSIFSPELLHGLHSRDP